MGSLFESVAEMLTHGRSMAVLLDALGVGSSDVYRSVEVATPAVLGAMADKAEQPGGLTKLTRVLDTAARPPQAGVTSMLRGDTRIGSEMLDGLFGSDRADLIAGLSKTAGVDSAAMSRLLTMSTPVVMGAVAQRRSDDGLSDSALTDLLIAERDEPNRSGLVGAGIGAGAAEATASKKTLSKTAGPATKVPTVDSGKLGSSSVVAEESSGGGLRWLGLGVGAVVLVALGALALSQLGGGGAEVVADATGPVDQLAFDDETSDGSGNTSDAASDADLQLEVDAAVSGMGVTGVVEDGVVTLTGGPTSEAVRADAESAVQAIDGVTSIDNQIVVDSEEGAGSGESDPAAGDTMNEILDLEAIWFATNSAEISAESAEVLDRTVEFMKDHPEVTVEIGGHTDSDGDDAANMDLSQSRADSVRAYLESQGIAGERVTARGYGETRPVMENDTDENKSKNRRIEFTIQ